MGFLQHLVPLNRLVRNLCTAKKDFIMKYLNVAEKNDAAKNIASILSRGSSTRREGISMYNKIYEFDSMVLGEPVKMVMTSVSGHLLNYEFESTFRNWKSCNPVALFDAPVVKICPEASQKIKNTLEREVRYCQGLIIWTDCDREGENIGYEIIQVCTDIKPDLRIYRAKFSEITGVSIFRAFNTLGQPDKNVSDAVDVRQELDLRTGAAFTRLQTLRLQKVFPTKLADKLISYGSCQFPTLGFVVERYQAIEDFVPENFWRIKMNHTVKELTTEFHWKRDRLFDKNACEAILDICKENQTATVESIENKPKSKWRPLPLDTVEMEKNISRKLKINAKEAMKIAEKLYTQGFISYPRTETNIFPKELNLTPLVEQQREDARWGPFAQRILTEGGPHPRQGKKSDQAHPPIHPTKYSNTLTGNEARVYEFIVRHFLACVQKDAQGFETVVNVDIANEKFTAKGLVILEKNYLEVYVYEKWNAKEINNYNQGDTFLPTVLDIVGSTTSPPKLLTEADLIALMDKHGIGTDATHADHIDTIKQRDYVGLHENVYFVPGTLGMGLVEGYNSIGLEVSLAKPILRSEFENDLKLICEGVKNAETVRQQQIQKYRSVFQTVVEKMRQIDQSLANRLADNPQDFVEDQIAQVKVILKCPKCGSNMVLRNRKNGPGQFISCTGYPSCNHAIWLSQSVDNVTVLDESCPNCGPDVKKLKIKFKTNLFPGEPNPNVLCIGGCDLNVLETLNINSGAIIRNPNRTAVQNQTIQYNHNSIRPNNVNVDPNRINNNSAPTVRTNYNNSTLNNMPGPSNMNQNHDEEMLCKCHCAAIQLTVRKDGPNKGRKFYKCQSGSCDFFTWDIQNGNSQNSPSTRTNSNEVKCNCGMPAVQKTVQKQGPNTGRKFYCCSKGMEEKCNFFQWADNGRGGGGGGGRGDDDSGGGGGGGGGSNSGPPQLQNGWRGKTKTNQGDNKRTAPYTKQTRSKKKCSKCRNEGHTIKTCPNN